MSAFDSNQADHIQQPTRRLSGKTALVTGAANGIGQSIAFRLASEGANVLAADIDLDGANACATSIRSRGDTAIACRVDVTNRADIRRMIEVAVGEFGSLNIAFNNAGVGHNSPFLDITEEKWDWMFTVNAKGVLFAMQEEARQMIEQGTGGKIINTASIAGRHGPKHQAHYGASKFAVIGLTQSAAKELAPYRITVNAMNPGIVDTPMWRRTDLELAAIYKQESGRAYEKGQVTEEFRSAIPLGRLAQPDDVASLAFFLASSDSDYITGQAINVDGGLVMD